MNTELTINIYHIVMIFGIIIISSIVAFLLHNFGGIKLFISKDIHITDKLLDKFPLVSSAFISKSAKEQNIENNQEIHELNKRLTSLEEAVKINFSIIKELKENGTGN